MPNINDPLFDEPRDSPGFRCLRARLSRQAGVERLGLSLWELPAGEASYPYHYHLTEEEMLIVLDGSPSLRTPEGWRELQEAGGGLEKLFRLEDARDYWDGESSPG